MKILILWCLLSVPLAAQEPKPEKKKVDLTLPTWFYIAGAGVDWSTASTCFGIECGRSPLTIMPGVNRPGVAVPVGLLIDGFVLYSTHKWIAPKWPRVAQGILYGTTVARGSLAAEKITNVRIIAKAGQTVIIVSH